MSLTNLKLKIGNNEYPLFDNLDDLKNSSDKKLKIEKDGKIYFTQG